MAKAKRGVPGETKRTLHKENIVVHRSNQNITYWLVLIGVILFIVIIRLRLLSLPLERDEGEYAYMGQLLLKGFAPFSEAYNMKFPGTSMMYALFMWLFGETVEGVHLGLLVMNVCTILLLFLSVKQYLGNLIALVTAITYAFISISPGVIGSAAHATHFVIFFAIPGIFLLLVALRDERVWQFFLSGLLLGMSILMKQPGLFFALFGALVFAYDYLFIKKPKWKKLLVYGSPLATGIVLPIAFLFLWMYWSDTFGRFWFWTFMYGRQYASGNSLQEGIALLLHYFRSLTDSFLLLWLLAPLGLIALWAGKYKPVIRLFVTAFTAVSFVSVCPGFYFREHYFVLLLPAVALLAGISVDFTGKFISEKLKRPKVSWIALFLFIAACVSGIVKLSPYLFKENMLVISRTMYGANPFPESVTIAHYIMDNTDKDDKIAVIGSEPQIYFYADRLSATGYIYMYSLMENQPFNLQMQEELIAETEANKPKILVFCNVPTSWLATEISPGKIFDWVRKFTSENYDLTGVVEIPHDFNPARYYWNDEAKAYQSSSENKMLIFRRRK